MDAAQDTPRLLAELGFFLTKAGMVREAQTMARGLAELRPDAEATHLLQGMLAFTAGRWADAEKHYRTAAEKHPDGAGLAFLGEALIAQKRTREAEETLAQALRSGDGPGTRLARELQEGLKQGLFRGR